MALPAIPALIAIGRAAVYAYRYHGVRAAVTYDRHKAAIENVRRTGVVQEVVGVTIATVAAGWQVIKNWFTTDDADDTPHDPAEFGFVNEDGFIDAPYPPATDTDDRDDHYRHGHEDDRHARSRESIAELGRSRRDAERHGHEDDRHARSRESIAERGRSRDRDTSSPPSPSNPGTRSGTSGTGSREAAERGNGGGGGGDGPGGGNSGGGFKPIVFDLDGDGIELVSLDESAAFYDINADGYQYHMGWAGADDGLLAFDKNGDGDITDKDEISFVGYKTGARTDWEGLAHFDSNNDGVLNNLDAEFAKFRVWQDGDGDGDVDAGELKTLTQHNIRSLDLNPNYGATLSPTERDGNLLYGEGNYTKTDGTRSTFGDVALATGAMGYRVNNGELEFKTADGVGKMHVAPAGSGAVNMNFASAVNAAHIGAIGGRHADVLNGHGVSRDLLLFGDEGDDRLTGGSGDDWLAGGAGADTLRGGAGHDVLFFEAGDDVHGGSGQDVGVVSGSGAIDLSMRAAGLEALHSGGGDDRLSGFDSAQGVIIDGGGGDDTIRGSHQRDVLSGGDGNDYIKGHKGEDVILSGEGADRLEGNRGDDLLFGGAGDDRLYGLIDDDTLFGGEGNDHLHGGEGDDYLKGQQGADWLMGGDGADRLEGNRGNDRLYGGEGDDYLNGQLGDDALYGGAGSDTYDFGYPNVPEGALPGFGRETVRDSGGANDKLTFGRRRHEDLWLSRDGDDLCISVLGGDDEVRVEDQFAVGGEHRIEQLHATTLIGSYGWHSGQSVSIDALVGAMARFDKPRAGWAHLTAQQRADVHAAWRTVGIAPTVGG